MVEWRSYTPITKEETITMDYHNCITVPPERKRGQHLGQEERGAIQQLKKQSCSLRTIAEYVHCSPSTVLYELRRGTPPRRSHKGRIPGYSAKRGTSGIQDQQDELQKVPRYHPVPGFYHLGGTTSPGTPLVAGCLRGLRKAPQVVQGR